MSLKIRTELPCQINLQPKMLRVYATSTRIQINLIKETPMTQMTFNFFKLCTYHIAKAKEGQGHAHKSCRGEHHAYCSQQLTDY